MIIKKLWLVNTQLAYNARYFYYLPLFCRTDEEHQSQIYIGWLKWTLIIPIAKKQKKNKLKIVKLKIGG